MTNTLHALREREWKPASSAPEGVEVETKIDDDRGCRNECVLLRRGRLWWTGPGVDAMYVYYTPTHWRARLLTALIERGE